jgi:hypothetical protein
MRRRRRNNNGRTPQAFSWVDNFSGSVNGTFLSAHTPVTGSSFGPNYLWVRDAHSGTCDIEVYTNALSHKAIQAINGVSGDTVDYRINGLIPATPDVTITWTWDTFAGAVNDWDWVIRGQSSVPPYGNHYHVNYNPFSDTLDFYYYNGTDNLLGTHAETIGDGEVVQFIATGNHFVVTVGGTSFIDITDNSLSSTGIIALRLLFTDTTSVDTSESLTSFRVDCLL